MTRIRGVVRSARLAAIGLTAVACANTTSGGESADTGGSAGAHPASGGTSPFGYGPNGYGFAGYGGDTGWAGQPSSIGGAAGSSAAQSCVGYVSPEPANPPTLPTCDAVAQAYEFGDAKAGVTFGWVDSTPGVTEHHETAALNPDLCGDVDALHLTISGQASYGGSYELSGDKDCGGYDGIALWVRAGTGTTAAFRLAIWDGVSLGQVVLDPATGEKACYNPGDDWDLDGHPNLSLPPWGLLCQGWDVNLTVGDQWQFVMLPWSIWSTTSAGTARAGIDPSDLRLWQLYTGACADFDLWIASIGPYRALTQP